MRKYLLGVLLILPMGLSAGPYSATPCLQSKVCVGLVDHFPFDEASDSARYGAFGATLHEPVTFNVGTGTLLTGTAASFDGTTNSYLWSSTFVPGMSVGWSMAFWFKPTSLPTVDGDYKALFSRSATGNLGTTVMIYKYPGTGNVYLCASNINKEGTTTSLGCKDTPLVANTVYFGAVGSGDTSDAAGEVNQTQIWASVNASAKMGFTYGFQPWSGISHFRVGQEPTGGKGATGSHGFIGLIRSVDIFARNIGPTDITLLYNGGAVRTYPYSTE